MLLWLMMIEWSESKCVGFNTSVQLKRALLLDPCLGLKQSMFLFSSYDYIYFNVLPTLSLLTSPSFNKYSFGPHSLSSSFFFSAQARQS